MGISYCTLTRMQYPSLLSTSTELQHSESMASISEKPLHFRVSAMTPLTAPVNWDIGNRHGRFRRDFENRCTSSKLQCLSRVDAVDFVHFRLLTLSRKCNTLDASHFHANANTKIHDVDLQPIKPLVYHFFRKSVKSFVYDRLTRGTGFRPARACTYIVESAMYVFSCFRVFNVDVDEIRISP